MADRVISHTKQQRNIQKGEPVRKPVLYMETMPDIVEHIDIKACIDQYKQCRLCDPFTQLDIFIQQIGITLILCKTSF
jgi:hypothetical protein